MATTVVLTNVQFDEAPSTKVRISFGDGQQIEYGSLAALQETIGEIDDDVSFTKRLCIAYALARSADLSNIASVRNKNFTFDVGDASPIKVQ